MPGFNGVLHDANVVPYTKLPKSKTRTTQYTVPPIYGRCNDPIFLQRETAPTKQPESRKRPFSGSSLEMSLRSEESLKKSKKRLDNEQKRNTSVSFLFLLLHIQLYMRIKTKLANI